MAGAWTLPSWLLPSTGSFTPAPGLLVAPHLRLVRPIEGGGAVVWVADQLVLQTEVAVHFAAWLPNAPLAAARTAQGSAPPDLGPRHDAERLLRQARSAARLADPHLLQIFEQGQTKSGQAFLVTELLEGRSLRQRLLQGGPLSLLEVHAVLQQAVGVLGKAHAIGLCHGSLRLEHLFLVEAAGELFLKLSGFGDTIDPGVDPIQDPVARAYLSPEQLLRATGSTPAGDAWALGVVLYELLTTTLPFEAPTAAGVSVAICNSQFSPPSQYRADLPAAVDDWFARAFAREPSDRFRNVLELAREFARALTSPAAVGLVDDAADADLEEEDFEDDERTRKWDLPSDVAATAAIRPAVFHPAVSHHALSAPPRGVAAAALPVYPRETSPMPLPSNAALGTVSALSARVSAVVGPSRTGSFAARLPMKTKGLIAGAVCGAAVVAIVWGYQSWSGEGEDVSAEVGATKPTRATTAARTAAARRAADTKDLPVLKMDQLPNAPDEDDIGEAGTRPAPEARAFAAVLSGSKAATPPARPAPPASPAPRHKSTKPASTEGDCNPPYYFDSNNIRRLKLDCL